LGLTINSVSDPPHGSANITSDGTIEYTPNPGYLGLDGEL